MLRALVMFVMLAVWTSPLYSLTESKFPPGSNVGPDSFGSPNYDSLREKQILPGAMITGHQKGVSVARYANDENFSCF